MSLAVGFPVARMGFGPFFVAQRLVKFIIRVTSHLVALPGRLAGSVAFGLLAVTLIFVPHTAFKHISAAAADNLFHGCHRSVIMKVGMKNGRNQMNYMKIFI